MFVRVLSVVATAALALGCATGGSSPRCQEDCELFAEPEDAFGGAADAFAAPQRLWPDGNVYVIVDDSALRAPERRQFSDTFFSVKASLGSTPVRVIEIRSPSDSPTGYFTRVQARPASQESFSTVGRRQAVEIRATAKRLSHELGHLIGLEHTIKRVDAAENIVIHGSWVDPKKARNFDTTPTSQRARALGISEIGPYDFESVMHYGAFAMSVLEPSGRECATITTVAYGADEDECVTEEDLEQADTLDLQLGTNIFYSEWDLIAITALYCDERFCEDHCAPIARCSAPEVEEHLFALWQWEASEEGRAWRERRFRESR